MGPSLNKKRTIPAGQMLKTVLLTSAICLASVELQSSMQSPRSAVGGPAAPASGTRGAVPPLRVSEIDGLREIGAGMFTITDPRPLARAAELLERKFGLPISYEEEVLKFSGDMVPASELP